MNEPKTAAQINALQIGSADPCVQSYELEIAYLREKLTEAKMAEQFADAACENLRKELARISVEVYDLKDRINKADGVLERLGYRHCDIPACNCNSYHKSQ